MRDINVIERDIETYLDDPGGDLAFEPRLRKLTVHLHTTGARIIRSEVNEL